MATRRRDRKSFSAIAQQRQIYSLRSDTRLTPLIITDVSPPFFPDPEESTVSAAFSSVAEASATVQGVSINTGGAFYVPSAVSVVTMHGTSADINSTSIFSQAVTDSVFVGVSQGVSGGAFSATGAEASMVLVGAPAAPGAWSVTAEADVDWSGTTSAVSLGRLSSIAESVMTMMGSQASTGPVSGRLVSSAESVMTMIGIASNATVNGVQTTHTVSSSYVNALTSWETWLGRTASITIDYIFHTGGASTAANWGLVAAPTHVYGWGPWKAALSGRQVVLTVPLGVDYVPAGTTPVNLLEQVAQGIGDTYYQTLADNLVANGLSQCYLAVGPQEAGVGYPWYAPPSSSNATWFAAAYKRVVDTMRARQPSAQWRFLLYVTTETAAHGISWYNQIYPTGGTPAYVDHIGINCFDRSNTLFSSPPYIDNTLSEATKTSRRAAVWNQLNGWLNFIRDFAFGKGKLIAFTEWAVSDRTDGQGGGDNPTFIQNMKDYFTANSPLYQMYYNVNWTGYTQSLQQPGSLLPNSSTKYVELFGVPSQPATSVALGLYTGGEGGNQPGPADTYWTGQTGRYLDVFYDVLHGLTTESWGAFNGNWTYLLSPTVQNNYSIYPSYLSTRPDRRFMLLIGLCPYAGAYGQNHGAMLASVAAGTHDSKFQSVADYLASIGLLGTVQRPVYINLGHEHGAFIFPWSCGTNPTLMTNYVGAYRRAVIVMRARQPNNNWKFCWVPAAYDYDLGSSWVNATFPGADVVDVIGSDFYDDSSFYPIASQSNSQQQINAWNNHLLPRLQAQNTLATTHNKPQCWLEWGCIINRGGLDYGTGGDNPYFVQQSYNWVTTHNFLFVNWFDYDYGGWTHQISDMPNARQAYINTFGQLPHPFT